MIHMIRVLLVDDHPMFRFGVARFLDASPGVEVVGEADDGTSGLTLIESTPHDVLVLDISMPKMGGIEVLRRLGRASGQRIVVMSHFPADPFAARVLQAGAHGFVSKTAPPSELLAAIRAVARGKIWLDGEADAPPTTAPKLPHEHLSSREYQVLVRLVQGRSSVEIAAELNISASTVSNHVSRIKEKLGAGTIAEIVSYAHRAGITQ